MGQATSIEWTATVNPDGSVTPGSSWNPVRGCSRVSQGCVNCYAERMAARFSDEGQPFHLFAERNWTYKSDSKQNWKPRWTGKVELVEKHLLDPLHWKQPKRIFVNSMSDLFHEALDDEAIDRVFAVMALCPQHTFQVLTKRPARMLQYLADEDVSSRVFAFQWELVEQYVDPLNRRSNDMRATAERLECDEPLPNVWLGVSCEDQKTADERIPLLLRTPAAVRFVSYEPALGPVDFTPWTFCMTCLKQTELPDCKEVKLDWIICGGESGPGARPFDIEWARNTIRQCKAAGVACFVKQLGATPMYRAHGDNDPRHLFNGLQLLHSSGSPLLDRKGGDWDEWPEELRVREYPRCP